MNGNLGLKLTVDSCLYGVTARVSQQFNMLLAGILDEGVIGDLFRKTSHEYTLEYTEVSWPMLLYN